MVLTHTLSGGHMTGGVLDSASKTAHLAWWALLLRGLLSVAVGVFIFARPMDSVAAFALVIALWALFTGFTSIVHAFELRPMMKHWWVLLLSGLVGVGFGMFALMYYPVPSLAFAVIWVSWLLTITGAIEIYAAMQERRSEEHTSELQSPCNLVCRLLLEKKKKHIISQYTFSANITKWLYR